MHDSDDPKKCTVCSPLLADLAELAKVIALPDDSMELALLQYLEAQA